MTLGLVVVAAAAWLGASLAAPVSLWWAVASAVALVSFARWARRRTRPLPPATPPVGTTPRGRAWAGRAWARASWVVGGGGCALLVGVVASALAADAWAGLDAPVPARLEGRVELVGDPRPTRFGVRVEARSGGRLWDLTADGGAAGVLRGLRAGESVEVAASTRRREPDDLWRASRHVVGTAKVEYAGSAEAAGGPWRVANAVHRAVQRSTAHLPADVRGVALGVALGDRGHLDDLLAEDLRAAGLSHLTAVSGQHVALLVAMAAPLFTRLSARGVVVATALLLVGFVILTRGEPSVLRAACMAVVVTVVRAQGRRAMALRVLGLVVIALVLIDPLIVWSVGFQLSVAATAGIATAAGRIGALLPGPRPVATALGVSLAAQIAVTPLVIAHFGVMPLVGVAANLAVVPVIGPLMGWTLVIGVLAGVVPALASLAHVPTTLLAGWVVWVAEWSAGWGLPGLRPAEGGFGPPAGGGVAVALTVAVLAGVLAWVRSGRTLVVVAVALVALLLSSSVVVGGPPTSGQHPLGAGAEAVVGGGKVVLVLDGRASPAVVVGGLRRVGADHLDVVVVRRVSPSAASLVSTLDERLGIGTLVVPSAAAATSWPATTGVGVDHVVGVGDRREVSVGNRRVVVSPGGAGGLDVVVG